MKYVSVEIAIRESGGYTVEVYKVFDWGRELKEVGEYATEEEAIKAYQLKHVYYWGAESPYWVEPPNFPINLNL
ncbi:hypothetical protein CBR56_07715 [Bacillus thuringiensis]|uniref:hypothetical protein n=1 Tax=Bacillus tropicus TaxID=2026188 RepID=UPI000B452F58|nr:hypothetical protein [Bacillus tropicus]MED3037259.1 hypothetical protein [Bacillus tropicus]OTX85109.1 hypothetical protein BK728_10805 [Bacillus thuringiensis serovar chanpaisis]PNK31481.1 hypothetical protein CBR56_07715 [Bacillus thuringiensis]